MMAKDRTAEMMERARKRFEKGVSACKKNHDNWLDDMLFANGEQWDPGVVALRVGRPCLTVNRIPSTLKLVTNDVRQSRPAIRVSPVDDGADVETAEVYQGLIRHIEYDSDASVAYDTAVEHSAGGGFGYIRIISEYCSEASFDQDLKIKRVRNPLSIIIDPDAKEADRSDMEWAFVVDRISKEEFERRYPDADVVVGEGGWALAQQTAPDWITNDSVIVAEYYEKEYTDDTLLLMIDGSTILESEYKKMNGGKAPEPAQVKDKRKTQIPTIKWYKINGVEPLEETDWPGRWIPIYPVLGDEVELKGEVILSGIVRNAKDPARLINLDISNEAEMISLMPKAPYIGPEGFVEGHENEWDNINTITRPYVQYRLVDVGGNPAPPPSRNFGEPAIQAITMSKMQHLDDFKSVTGLFDASRGAQSNETSGKAINARKAQGEMSNFHIMDNLARTQRHIGRSLVDLFRYYYAGPRVINIIGEDNEQRMVAINKEFEEKGKIKKYEIGKGKYDVTVSVGPSFATKRQEAVASMIELSNGMPELKTMMADQIAKSMDWPGSQTIAKRLKKMLPPGIDDEEGEGQPPLPPQVAQQMEMMGQQLQMAEQAIGQMQQQAQAIAQENATLKVQMQAKEGELALKTRELDIKAQELELKGAVETAKIANDRKELELKEREIEIAAGKLEQDDLRMLADQVNRDEDAEKDEEEPEKDEKEPEKDEKDEKEEPEEDQTVKIAAMLENQAKTILQGIEAIASAPMPPQTVVMKRQPDGSLTGKIQEGTVNG